MDADRYTTFLVAIAESRSAAALQFVLCILRECAPACGDRDELVALARRHAGELAGGDTCESIAR